MPPTPTYHQAVYEVISTDFNHPHMVTIRIYADPDTIISELRFPDLDFIDYAKAIALALVVVRGRTSADK